MQTVASVDDKCYHVCNVCNNTGYIDSINYCICNVGVFNEQQNEIEEQIEAGELDMGQDTIHTTIENAIGNSYHYNEQCKLEWMEKLEAEFDQYINELADNYITNCNNNTPLEDGTNSNSSGNTEYFECNEVYDYDDTFYDALDLLTNDNDMTSTLLDKDNENTDRN